jgi:segregation and condensation protein A
MAAMSGSGEIAAAEQAHTAPMRQDDYQVTLDMFHGPLDLLLYLIRRAEVDITEVPLAEITDQYLALLHQLDDIDIDQAGEFLVIAATLIEVKSRTLAPAAQGEDADNAESGGGGPRTAGDLTPTDPGFELIQQLLAYQRFRIASEELEKRRAEFIQRYPNRPAKRPSSREEDDQPTAAVIELELEDVHIIDLSDAYEHITASIDFNRLGDHTVEMDDTPIALYQADLMDRLTHAPERRMTLQEAFADAERPQRIGLFLAVLELVRLRKIVVQQDVIDGAIELTVIDDGDNDDETEESSERIELNQ